MINMLAPLAKASVDFRFSKDFKNAMSSPALQGGVPFIRWRSAFMPTLANRLLTLNTALPSKVYPALQSAVTALRKQASDDVDWKLGEWKTSAAQTVRDTHANEFRVAPRAPPVKYTVEALSNYRYLHFRDLTTKPDVSIVFTLGCWLTGRTNCAPQRYHWTTPLLYDHYEPHSTAEFRDKYMMIGYQGTGPRTGEPSLIVLIDKAKGSMVKIFRLMELDSDGVLVPCTASLGGLVPVEEMGMLYSTDGSGGPRAADRGTWLLAIGLEQMEPKLRSTVIVHDLLVAKRIDTGIVASGVSFDPDFLADEEEDVWEKLGVDFGETGADGEVPRLWVWETYRPAANGQRAWGVKSDRSYFNGHPGVAAGFGLSMESVDQSAPDWYAAPDADFGLTGYADDAVEPDRKVYIGPNVHGFLYGYEEMEAQGKYVVINRCEADPSQPCRLEFHILAIYDEEDAAFHIRAGPTWIKSIADGELEELRFSVSTKKMIQMEPVMLDSVNTLRQAVRIPWGAEGLSANWAYEGEENLAITFASGAASRFNETQRLGLDWEDQTYIMRYPVMVRANPQHSARDTAAVHTICCCTCTMPYDVDARMLARGPFADFHPAHCHAQREAVVGAGG
ncbi:MAG: hypothetical protein EOO65_02085 [Methanosarcinales archaeon]|nr:MAG: hypothetical protein EOO65_02085 [Methanosarcinales archaeon]